MRTAAAELLLFILLREEIRLRFIGLGAEILHGRYLPYRITTQILVPELFTEIVALPTGNINITARVYSTLSSWLRQHVVLAKVSK